MEDGTVVPNDDYLLEDVSIRGQLPRNMRDWLAEAEDLRNGNLTSVKLLYSHFLDCRNHKPRVESEYPEVDWPRLWENLSKNYLPTDWRASVYMIVNDALPNTERLRRHRITSESPVCMLCNNNDDNVHRLKLCIGAASTWNWLNFKLKNVMRLEIDDPEELLVSCLNKKEEAGLWLTFGVMHFNFQKYKNGQIKEMENMIRQVRWSKRHILERKFDNLLNIF